MYLSPRISGTQNGGTEPYKAILGVGKLPYISRIYTAYIGFCTSILGTWKVWWTFGPPNNPWKKEGFKAQNIWVK